MFNVFFSEQDGFSLGVLRVRACPDLQAKEEGGEGAGEAEVQLRRAVERGLLPGDEGVVGEVSRARNGDDHHKDRKVRDSSISILKIYLILIKII